MIFRSSALMPEFFLQIISAVRFVLLFYICDICRYSRYKGIIFYSGFFILFLYHTVDYVYNMTRCAIHGVGGETAKKVSSILILSKSLILTAA